MLGITIVSWAKKEHRHHDSHVHGAAEVQIAFDGLNGKVEFRAASEGVLGFEYDPKSEKEKAKLSEVQKTFETEFSKMVQFDAVSECTWTFEKAARAQEESEKKHEEVKNKKDLKSDKHKGEHSDFVATANVLCKKSIVGSVLNLNFMTFKKLKDIDVTILVDQIQKSVEVKGKPVKIELK